MTVPLIKSFQIYYGPLTATAQMELQSVDLCILEPRYAEPAAVQKLHAAGTMVLGYLSVIELPTWNEQRFASVEEQDFLKVSQKRFHFPDWDSYLMDLRRHSYRELLLAEVKALIVEKQLDGVFLDTVGDIEEYVPDVLGMRQVMMQAYVNLLQQIRIRTPHLYLLQNRGFGVLRAALPYLQGVLWEGWRGDLVNDSWVQQRLRLLEMCQPAGLHRFAITDSADPIHAKVAREHHFVHLTRSGHYHLLENPDSRSKDSR